MRTLNVPCILMASTKYYHRRDCRLDIFGSMRHLSRFYGNYTARQTTHCLTTGERTENNRQFLQPPIGALTSASRAKVMCQFLEMMYFARCRTEMACNSSGKQTGTSRLVGNSAVVLRS